MRNEKVMRWSIFGKKKSMTEKSMETEVTTSTTSLSNDGAKITGHAPTAAAAAVFVEQVLP
jgi:hypothetical protein